MIGGVPERLDNPLPFAPQSRRFDSVQIRIFVKTD